MTSPTSACPFRTYLRHLLALAPLPDEAGEADDIRDEMDAPWYAMSESDRELAAQVSEALQRLAPARESAQCILPETGEQQYSMESPCCGAKVFLRAENFFTDGEAERCPDCGDLVIVTVSDDYADDARIDVIVEGCPLDNWPRPYGAAACADKGEEHLSIDAARRAAQEQLQEVLDALPKVPTFRHYLPGPSKDKEPCGK